MKTTQLSALIGIDAKAIRNFARKTYGAQHAAWDFNEDQVSEISKHFAGQPIKNISTAAPSTEPAPSKQGGLTPHETAVMEYLCNSGWFEAHFSDLEVADIALNMKLPLKSMKGYIGSLSKKGYVYVSEADGEVPPLVYPGELVQWSDELHKNTY